MRLIVRRLRALFNRERLDRDMDDEMRLHLALETEDLVRSGVAPDEARRRARAAFGGVERFKDEGRDVRGIRWTEDLGRDTRLGVRQMGRNAGFTVAALVTLTLGIGATTAMFGMVDAVLLHPLPFDNSDELVLLEQCGRGCQRMAIGNYLSIRDDSRTLQAVAAIGQSSPILRGAERTEMLTGARVTIDLFAMTSVPALLGRTFAPPDTITGSPRVVLISEGAWRSRFGADSGLVGRSLTLDGTPATVIGVVPTRYAFPVTAEVWTLIPLDARAAADRYWTDFNVLGRLRPGVSITDVAAEMRAMTARLGVAFPDAMRRVQLTVRPSRGWNDQVLLPITIFMTAVVLIVVIACTNLAGLLLTRLTIRQREIAVRVALGAARGRIARQLLTETLLVSVIGGVLGVAAAWAMTEGLRGSVPADAMVGWSGIGVRWGAFAVALGMGMMTGLVIGIGPVIRFSRPDLVESLKEGARGTVGGTGARVRRALVIAQLAFSIVLVVAAGLLTRTAMNVYRADIGIQSDHVLTMRLQHPPQLDSTRQLASDYFDRLVSELERSPGVVRAATVSWVPFTGFTSFGFEIEGRPPTVPGDRPWGRMQAATAGYFDVMGIRLVKGRSFNDGDVAGAPRVVVISENGARRLFNEKGEEAIGRALIMEGRRYEIVGVSREVQHFGAQVGGNALEVYYVQSQWPRRGATLVVRTKGDPAAAASAITRCVYAFDRDLGISRVATMTAVADRWLSRYRVMAGVMVAFALIALLISAIGLYGVINFAVAQRTREFGIRLALGASQRELLGLVLHDGLRLAGVGVAVGFAGALGLTQALRALLYDTGPVDPMVLGSVTVTFGALAVGASLAPARRATRVDPMTSLRTD